ncbi:hypothetical protein AB0I00_06835 [Streptomyces sp. NPDC050803]|uniref:hypothetical protein n=1 Tax=unclassified Streptomyces TaxID=2593676 RepID=UPI003446AE5D
MGKHTDITVTTTDSGETVIQSSTTTTDADGHTHTATHTAVLGPGTTVINGDNHTGISQNF